MRESPAPIPMVIVALDQREIRREGARLEEIERAVFPDGPWTLANFLLLLPFKFELSVVAEKWLRREERRDVLGYIVAHGRYEQIHVSRVAVHPRFQRRHVFRGMFWAFLAHCWYAHQVRPITIQVDADNAAALHAYAGVRFEKLTGADLDLYLRAHDPSARREGDAFLDSETGRLALALVRGSTADSWVSGI